MPIGRHQQGGSTFKGYTNCVNQKNDSENFREKRDLKEATKKGQYSQKGRQGKGGTHPDFDDLDVLGAGLGVADGVPAEVQAEELGEHLLERDAVGRIPLLSDYVCERGSFEGEEVSIEGKGTRKAEQWYGWAPSSRRRGS